MATWRSRRALKYLCDMGDTYANRELSWEYGTVSDTLRIKTDTEAFVGYSGTCEATTSTEYYGKWDALATLETLLDWAFIYEGEHVIEEMMKRIKRDVD